MRLETRVGNQIDEFWLWREEAEEENDGVFGEENDGNSEEQ